MQRALRFLMFIGGLAGAPMVATAEAGDPVAGADHYDQCIGCHQIGADAAHGVGPHLNNIFGRQAASHEGVRYSRPLQKASADGLEWQDDTLDAFLEDPRDYVKGTRMGFRGIADPVARRDLIAYLRSFSGDANTLPEAAAGANDPATTLDPAILALEGDPAYGQYLSGDCTGCHQTSGENDGIPSIVQWPIKDFVTAMHAYKNNHRENQVMQMMAGRLSAEEIAALAAYFATLEN